MPVHSQWEVQLLMGFMWKCNKTNRYRRNRVQSEGTIVGYRSPKVKFWWICFCHMGETKTSFRHPWKYDLEVKNVIVEWKFIFMSQLRQSSKVTDLRQMQVKKNGHEEVSTERATQIHWMAEPSPPLWIYANTRQVINVVYLDMNIIVIYYSTANIR